MTARISRSIPAGSDILDLLRRLRPAILAGITHDGLSALLAEARMISVSQPLEVLRQGEVADWAYLILKGRIEVSYLDRDGNRVLAHLAGPGEVMGEVEQFSGRTCAAGCTALPDSKLLLVNAAMIMRHMPHDQLIRNLANIFHDRLTRDNRQQSIAMFYASEHRVRIHLLSLTRPDAPQIRLSQAELAAFAGCSRQTVNRTLSQLRAEGIVDLGRGTIRVLDRARLRDAGRGHATGAGPEDDVASLDMPKA